MLNRLFALAPAADYKLNEKTIASFTGLDEALFSLERKKQAYKDPEEAIDKRIKAYKTLKMKQQNMMKSLMTSADVAGVDGVGGIKLSDLLPDGLSASEWASIPYEKKQKLAITAITAKTAVEQEMIDAYFPESFKKASKQGLELKSLKNMMK